MSVLKNELARAEKEDISRAIRLLLGRPLISQHTDPDDFGVIRLRHRTLAQWFDYYCGWRLHLEPRLGYARLVKVRAGDPSRPARRRRTTRAPFDRRRYTLLCLVAAEALAGPVTTIGMLAQRVVQASAADEHVPPFDPVRGDERAAFVDALKLLEHYGAVTAVDGVTDAFLASADAKVLYRVDATRVIRLLSAPVAPSRLQDAGWPDLAALTVERRYGGEEPTETQRNLWARHALLRRLLDDPVVYRADLTPAELAYAASPTGRQILRRAADEAGLELEERAEGYLLVDPEGLATDSRFPDDGGHAKVAALLLLDTLTRDGPASMAGLEREAERVLGRFPRWAMAYRSDGGARRLAEDAAAILCGFGLARREEGRVAALPAAHRYTVRQEEA